MDKIDKSGKRALIMLKQEAMHDVRSVTGCNFRNIMLLAGKSRVVDVSLEDAARVKYHQLEEENKWKVKTIMEIINVKAGTLELPGFEQHEMETILGHLCTD